MDDFYAARSRLIPPLPWPTFAPPFSLEDIDAERGPKFTVENMAIEAAINGAGVALVSHSAVGEDLKAGRLVRPFDLTVQSDIAYWLVCPETHLRRAKVRLFHDWLLSKTARGTGESNPEIAVPPR